MPPVVAWMVAHPIAAWFIGTTASLVLGKLTQEDPSMPTMSNTGIQANKQSMKNVIPVIYGETRIGVNRCFVATSGTDNKFLHIIGIIGEGEIEGFSDQIHWGTGAQEDDYDPIYFDNKLYPEFGRANVDYELFTGSATQSVCSDLQTAIPAWTDPLKNTAYLYIRIKFNINKFQHIPNITVGVKGTKIYNPYTEVTEYSNNPALCVYDLMTRSAVRGGFGIDGSRIDTNSVEDARAYCGDKGWTCNMPINTDVSITDNIQFLLNNFRGGVIKSMNKFYIRYKELQGDYSESVVMAFDVGNPRDIISSSFSIKQPDLFKIPKAVNIEYLSLQGGESGENTYKVHNFIHSDNESVGDEAYTELKVQCLGLSDLEMVQQMAFYFLERSKLNKTCTFVAGQKATSLEPLDLITITHNIAGWDTKIFRVGSVSLNTDYTVTLSCVEEHEDFYDETYDGTIGQYHDTNLPDPTSEPVGVSVSPLTEEVYYYRNRSFTKLLIDFDPPTPEVDPFWDYAEISVRVGSTGDYTYLTKSSGSYNIDPVQEGDTYYVKLKSVNIFGNKGEDENDILVSKTIAGRTTGPSNLTSMSAIANGDSVSIFADPINEPDIEGYEVRLGDAWSGAIFISFNKSCSLRLNGVRPGTHTFWMSPKDNGGLYSETPVSATCTVFIPPGYTELTTYGSWSWDFDGIGIHSNTGHTTYDTSDALECTHGVTVWKTSAAAWDTSYYADSGTINDAVATFKAGQTNMHIAAGLSADPSAFNDFGNLEYAWYLGDAGVCAVYESNSPVATYGSYTTDTIFTVEYDGTDVIYTKDGATMTTNNVGAGLTLSFDSCLYNQYAIMGSISFTPAVDFNLSTNCAVIGDTLQGTWTSTTHDLNSLEDVRIWGDFLTGFSSGATTWIGVAPSPTTWDDLDNGEDLSWNEIFNPEAAGKIQATLLHSTDESTWNEVDFFEICSAELQTQYLKVRVTITDPTLDANLYLKELNMLAYEGPQ